MNSRDSDRAERESDAEGADSHPLSVPSANWTSRDHAKVHLGYRGHILTRSRAYSTTYAALRADRAEHVGPDTVPGTATDGHCATSAPATPPAPHSWPLESPKTPPRTVRSPVKSVRRRGDEMPQRTVGSGGRAPGRQVPHTDRAEKRYASRAAPRPCTEGFLEDD
ncbi:replication initiator [Streptomyces sp. NPDC058086]|uniref:replication initiator n=1 Tax=Streptomyces sp. NPDC058086 TaxID=3346334 RepID=UPI0036E2D135